MIRVAVLGVAGRMGRVVAEALEDDQELELVAGINPGFGGANAGGPTGGGCSISACR